MGKGYNNYMSKKFFHPATFENIKRVWMAQQKIDHEKAKEDERLAQYQREQDVYQNKALLGDEKAKIGLSFMYEPPPGANRAKEKEDDEPEYKFEWQRKYNAPRENYAKGDETIRDQPFGIEVRNVRCIKCKKWGHVNTDKICPLFGKNLTAEPPAPGSSTSELAGDMEKDQGFRLKQSVMGKKVNPYDRNQQFVESDQDEEDPEVAFLKSLTPKQKKKLLKKLDKLQRKQSGEEKKKKKKSKKGKHPKKESSEDSDSESEADKKKKRSKKRHSDDSDSDGPEPKKGYGKNKYVRQRSPSDGRRQRSPPDGRRQRSPPDDRRRQERTDFGRDDTKDRRNSFTHREDVDSRRHRGERHSPRKQERDRSPKKRQSRSRSPHERGSRIREDKQKNGAHRLQKEKTDFDQSHDRQRSGQGQGHSKTRLGESLSNRRQQSHSTSSSSSSSDSSSESEEKDFKHVRDRKSYYSDRTERGHKGLNDRRDRSYERKFSDERSRDSSKRK